DLFGIQTRAGCSCAGPYGHYLMKIDPRLSDFYRCVITNAGYAGIKPGWVRLNLHYIMDNDEVDYLINALNFICEYGYRFIPLYVFNIKNGEWNHRDGFEVPSISLSLDDAVHEGSFCHTQPSNAPFMYETALKNAYKLAESLSDDFSVQVFEPELEKLMFFYVHKAVNHHFNK
ncbi:MAG: hypothetical protein PHO32_03990, partial [Candidatus Cloacimonetes bacterium]|nr:hypothetical protein [Candidatus Cloacimonadota bacterium]